MRAVVLVSAPLTGALLLAGCGGQGQQPSPAGKAPAAPTTATSLTDWVSGILAEDLPDLHAFVNGLCQEHTAVATCLGRELIAGT
ncbi:hypothetical protein TH66_02295 [Carbonactinospora thermoautotrophica]|uniref:Putative lipoprotein n=1 Tax=Carbonactinospora thermoautotrophica TaxID=1469144 RepID=A0A132N7B2_9ACTN|nr:hypothetical protein [Carbonactinospora thermoautotrophica]KWX01165.1 putative lipoprotein [Carbonactinospora thermoautotrophica]KWX05432.1 hypothetical protein TR74_23755 [Carbonactinospora thermoautotrophica]KWX05523.1 hypothetical protein TH66_02295 [Carbonactinospora thermoautotrophica]